jgi:protein-L-isoaspartate(D-aspartate) O-methyltransferase
MAGKEELISHWKEFSFNEELIAAFREVPREQFVAPSMQQHAYNDQPLPTLRKQSISQPTTIMIMLQALDLQKGERVFEIGAGVGYQAAIISKVVGERGKLVSAEIVPELVQSAKENLDKLEIENVTLLEDDGSKGDISNAPYDKIIITAACPQIPQPLIEQLKEGGLIVAPIGDLESQMMVRATKTNNRLDLEFLGTFAFVPLRGKYGFKEVELS